MVHWWVDSRLFAGEGCEPTDSSLKIDKNAVDVQVSLGDGCGGFFVVFHFKVGWFGEQSNHDFVVFTIRLG